MPAADTTPPSDPNASRSSPEGRWREPLTRAAIVLGFVVAAILVLHGTSAPADARFPIDNFTDVDDTATVTPSGSNVAVTGWVKCTDGDVAEVRVTVTQDATRATGKTHVRCLGEAETQYWEIHVAPRGPAVFDADAPVRVDAWAVPQARGQRTDDPHTWTNDEVTLVPR